MAHTRTISSKQTGRHRWVAVEKLLPEPVALELRQATDAVGDITSKVVAELDRRFEIERRYGVSKRRLGNYLRRVRASQAAPSDSDSIGTGNAEPKPDSNEPSGASPEPEPQSFDERIIAHRRRQASVGAILSETFGRFAESSPDLWDRRAYLMLVGIVYERLATNEDELSTEELVTLSKILAESRRAEAQSHKRAPDDEDSRDNTSPSDELPEHFAETVRQVYGTNFQMPIVAAKS